MVPRSVNAGFMVSLLLSLCRSSTLFAITSPLKLCHGPAPIRSRALTAVVPPTAWVLRYARHVLPPAPAFWAKVWHCRSAPSNPPRSAPLPSPALVTKNVMLGACGGGCCARPTDTTSVIAATDEIMAQHFVRGIGILSYQGVHATHWHACPEGIIAFNPTARQRQILTRLRCSSKAPAMSL